MAGVDSSKTLLVGSVLYEVGLQECYGIGGRHVYFGPNQNKPFVLGRKILRGEVNV
jgi:hypothetical protein